MTKEEFYKTISVLPINLINDCSSTDILEKYNSWELLLTSCIGEKYVCGRIKWNSESVGGGLAKLTFLQNEVNQAVEEMYVIFLKEMKEGDIKNETKIQGLPDD